MVYRWQGGSFAGDKSRAQAVGDALERVRVDAEGGILAAQDVVAAARPPASVLHRFFEWDDRKAARAHRLEQARELVKAVVVVVPDADAPEPAFTPTVADGIDGPAFERAAARRAFMPSAPPSREARLNEAYSALRKLRSQFADLPELAPVLRVIEEQLEQIDSSAFAHSATRQARRA